MEGLLSLHLLVLGHLPEPRNTRADNPAVQKQEAESDDVALFLPHTERFVSIEGTGWQDYRRKTGGGFCSRGKDCAHP